MHSKRLEPSSRSVRLTKLQPNSRYRVCVLGLGSWLTRPAESNALSPSEPRFNGSHNEVPEKSALPDVDADAATSRCTDALTLELPDAVASSDGSSINSDETSDNSGGSVLTRRLGLIVGCCMGFVVFILLVSVLGYLKVCYIDSTLYNAWQRRIAYNYRALFSEFFVVNKHV